MPKLRDYRWFQENYPVDIPDMDISPESMEIDMPSGAGYIGAPPTSPEDTALIGQLMRGKPPAFFGDPEGRAEDERLDEELLGLQAEREGIQAEVEKLTPEQRAYYEKTLAAGRRKPPEGYQVPDFSDAGRHRYEQGVFRQIEEIWKIPRGNPYNINSLDAVDEALRTQWPGIVEQVFGIRFSDVDQLQGKDAKDYQEMLSSFRKSIREKAEFALTRAKVKYKEQMAIYDGKRKKYEGKRAQIETDRLKRIATAPQKRVNKYDELTWHEMDETGQWKDTGKLVKEEEEDKFKPVTLYRQVAGATKPQEFIAKSEEEVAEQLSIGFTRIKPAEMPKDWWKDKKGKDKDELKKSQMLDDWRSDYKTRLNQLKDDYGDFNAMTGLWSPKTETYEKYKKQRDKLINEYETGMRSIFEGKVPKRMAGTLVGARQEEDYVGKFIQDLTKGY